MWYRNSMLETLTLFSIKWLIPITLICYSEKLRCAWVVAPTLKRCALYLLPILCTSHFEIGFHDLHGEKTADIWDLISIYTGFILKLCLKLAIVMIIKLTSAVVLKDTLLNNSKFGGRGANCDFSNSEESTNIALNKHSGY